MRDKEKEYLKGRLVEDLRDCSRLCDGLKECLELDLKDIPTGLQHTNDRYNAEHNLKDIVDAAVSLRGIIKTLEELNK